jgi:cytochrome b561
MERTPDQKFFLKGIPVIHGVFTILLWLRVIIRFRGNQRAKIQFPRCWRNASAIMIFLSAFLATIYLCCIIAQRVFNNRAWNTASGKNIPAASLTSNDFTETELRYIAELFYKSELVCFPLLPPDALYYFLPYPIGLNL